MQEARDVAGKTFILPRLPYPRQQTTAAGEPGKTDGRVGRCHRVVGRSRCGLGLHGGLGRSFAGRQSAAARGNLLSLPRGLHRGCRRLRVGRGCRGATLIRSRPATLVPHADTHGPQQRCTLWG